jgi:hypothetical protein
MKQMSRSPRNITLAIGLSVAVLLVAIAVTRPDGAATEARQFDGEVRYTQASWAHHFEDVAGLTTAADLVVVGTVAGIEGANADTTTAGAVTSTLRFTDFVVDVHDVFAGTATDDQITIHQTGGQDADGVRTEIMDDPLLEIGETYIFFMRTDPASHRYVILGGPQGRLMVTSGGRASSLSEIYTDRGISDLGLRNVPLAKIASDVRAHSARTN